MYTLSPYIILLLFVPYTICLMSTLVQAVAWWHHWLNYWVEFCCGMLNGKYVWEKVSDLGDQQFMYGVLPESIKLLSGQVLLYWSQNPLEYNSIHFAVIIPPEQRSCWGVYWFHSVRPSVCPSVRPSVRPSRLPCPLCNIYSSGWILSILATNDHYHERVCRTQWPLTLTYIFKVIWPWLRKSCPLCSVYSSGWIIFIFSTNDHYH